MSCGPKGDSYFHPQNGLERVFRPLNCSLIIHGCRAAISKPSPKFLNQALNCVKVQVLHQLAGVVAWVFSAYAPVCTGQNPLKSILVNFVDD